MKLNYILSNVYSQNQCMTIFVKEGNSNVYMSSSGKISGKSELYVDIFVV